MQTRFDTWWLESRLLSLFMAKTKTAPPAAPVADIARTILVLHRQRVILDADLAALYGVTTKRLNEQVKRNAARFPEDFMFRLSAEETEALNRSQFAILNVSRKKTEVSSL